METSYLGNKLESLLIKVLKDMQPYKEDAVLIGGWLPYIYHNYLWKSKKNPQIISTKDIDFALREDFNFKGQVLEEMFAKKEYYKKERVYDPEEVPFYFAVKEGEDELRIDFLSHEYVDPSIVARITGGNIEVAPVEYIEYMLKKENTEVIHINPNKENIQVRIPKPAVYVYVKGLSCGERELKERGYKFKKDLWAIYFVLDNLPTEHKDEFINKIVSFKTDKEMFNYFIKNLNEYFGNSEAEGPCAVSELLELPKETIKKRSYEVVSDFINSIS